MHFLEELNPVQRQAACQTEGPVMIIAGAGSGKTRVLTFRIAHLMEKGVDPFNILALTFTNKAAREMKSRIGKLVGDTSARALWMGTFHSIFAKMLRFEAERLGYPKNFTIYDTDDSKGVIKEILKLYNLDDKVYKPSLVLNRISSAKNNLISPRQYMNNAVAVAEDKASQKPMMGQIFETYNKRLFKSGAMDFDDLLYNTNVLLRDHPDVLLKYQDKFRYILVDEYQDTNFSQYVIVKQLAARFMNICVVGDDAQSIYAFRGANIQNILNFAKDYPDYKEFKLEQNYRSTQNIVNVANRVIANNKDQFKKNVWTENEAGEKIKVIKANTDNEEGNKVAAALFEIKMNKQARNRDFAILYRTNAQSRAIEEALRKRNFPYRIYGGVSFYQRKEIKDVLAYFRLSINNHDDESLRRIINYPTRGIGQTTVDKIIAAASDNNVSMWTVVDNLKEFNLGLNSGVFNKVSEFAALIKSFSFIVPVKDAFECANQIAINSGILKDLYSDKTPEGLSRYENIQELLNGIKDFSETHRNPQEEELKENILAAGVQQAEDLFATAPEQTLKTIDEFMQDIALLTDADKEKEDEKDADKISLMTIHAAKGLEFPYVFIVGLEENLFPSQMSLNSRADLEEERRLFYVALTRAEKNAVLSYANTRYRFGNLIYCEPSRFIDELDSSLVDFPEEMNATAQFDASLFRNFHEDEQPAKRINFNPAAGKKPVSTGAKENLTSSIKKNLVSVNTSKNVVNTGPIDIELVKNLKVGDWVEHEKFGKGQVRNMEGNFPNLKASIFFADAGEKQLLLRFARLKVLNG